MIDVEWGLLKRDRLKLETIRVIVRERYETTQKNKYYETYNPSHCEAVEKKLTELIPDNNKLTNTEKFLLIAALWIYPQSLIPSGIRRFTEHIRLELQKEEAEAIREICRYQRKTEDINSCPPTKTLNGDKIRLKLISAYLRLADTLHIDKGDIMDIPQGISLMFNISKYERFHWLKKIVATINPDPSNSIIEVRINIPNDWSEKNIVDIQNRIIEEIKEELDKVKNILILGHISIFLDVIANIQPIPFLQEKKVELERIINNFELSISPNAGKIIEIVLKNIISIINENKLKELKEYLERLKNVIDERPCHIALQKIWENFRPDLMDIDILPKNKREKRIKKIKEKSKSLKERRDAQIKALVVNAIPFLLGGGGILLFGLSDTVLKALESLSDDEKNDTIIYVSECRNKTRYSYNNRLDYNDGIFYAARVKEKGFRYVRIIPDIAIADFFKSGKIKRVVLGANGIDEKTHAISHTLGYVMIDDIARVYSVPIYILADSLKFGKLNPMPFLERKGNWLTTEKRFEEMIVNNNITLLNPREEIIPQDKVTAIITDIGIFPEGTLPKVIKTWKPHIYQNINELLDSLKTKINFSQDRKLEVLNEDKSREEMDNLVYNGVFNPDEDIKDACNWIIRNIGYCLKVIPASIYEFYNLKSSEDTLKNMSVPAFNIRGLSYDTMRAVIRSAIKNNTSAFILEIARTEISYTKQTPKEYGMVSIAAAIREGYKGPIFIQGDHFKIDLKAYKQDPERELSALKSLIKESIEAGFYNIDLDTSTLVDLDKPTIAQQQRKNFEMTAELTRYIREIEPEEITVCLGGEIGEIGGENSTERELIEYIEGFYKMLGNDYKGISKVAIQTGTTHGGVPLADGTIALVNLDFKTLEQLSKLAREKYKLAGCVQHGASTLPPDAFSHFPETCTAEVHLATEFQNIIYDDKVFPAELREKIYDYLYTIEEKKAGQTDEQFIYKSRKKGFGHFKKEIWNLPQDIREEISGRLQNKFDFLFKSLRCSNVYNSVQDVVKQIPAYEPMPEGLTKVLSTISAIHS